MKEIRFTLDNSDDWYVIYADFEIYTVIQTGQVVANIITDFIKRIKTTDVKPKKVEIKDEKGMLLASSTDICIVEELKIKQKK